MSHSQKPKQPEVSIQLNSHDFSEKENSSIGLRVASEFEIPKPTTGERFRSYFFGLNASRERTIGQSGEVYPPNYVSNKTDNTRYNILTFFPGVFYHQFKHFLNLFFLLMAITQLFPPLRIGVWMAEVMPSIVIIVISYTKEFVDEMQRRMKDKLYNEELFV